MIDLLVAGEVMTAVRCDGPLRLGGSATVSVVGAEAGVAIGAARLGHSTALGGRVGADESGALVRRTLAAEQVAVDAVVTDPDATTGLVLFERRTPDLTRVEYHRRGSAGSRWGTTDLAPALALRPRAVHLSGVTAALSESCRTACAELARRARLLGAVVSVDLNHRPALWPDDVAGPALAALAGQADVVIGSPEEFALIGAADPAELLAGTPGEVVVKNGVHGATSHDADGPRHRPALRVRAVDPVGAGDAFCAGWLSALLDGADRTERLDRAVTVGAFAVTARGDWEGLPRRDELSLLDLPDGAVVR
ncbi:MULTISPECIES: sugar kinase [Pseudonocardia]|uniref:sugar kinase n=1 Tax=Pseudonocardia TaxID=1847 RepID=UPI00091ED06E|nr:2-dehydro-3-deoxygluconokinase [Pseudonocardia autotrophica]